MTKKTIRRFTVIDYSKEMTILAVIEENGTETVIGIGQYEGDNRIDLEGKYLCPGFLDGHVHIDNDQILKRTAQFMHDRDVSVLSRPQFLETPDNTRLQNAIAYARTVLAQYSQPVEKAAWRL